MEVILDCCRLTDKVSAHCYLKEQFSFPDWYGNNLDALFDCLCEAEVSLTLQGWKTLGKWREGFWSTMLDAAQENPLFTFKE